MHDPRTTAAGLETFMKPGFGDDAANIELDCLAVATCFDKNNDAHKAHAKLAKKALKKHASAPTAAALASRPPPLPPSHSTQYQLYCQIMWLNICCIGEL